MNLLASNAFPISKFPGLRADVGTSIESSLQHVHLSTFAFKYFLLQALFYTSCSDRSELPFWFQVQSFVVRFSLLWFFILLFRVRQPDSLASEYFPSCKMKGLAHSRQSISDGLERVYRILQSFN